MGGQPDSTRRMLCMCFCAPCATCQLTRAIAKAESSGQMKKIGAPDETEMAR
jgi:hypothetical protein